jgi:hypothetical protein
MSAPLRLYVSKELRNYETLALNMKRRKVLRPSYLKVRRYQNHHCHPALDAGSRNTAPCWKNPVSYAILIPRFIAGSSNGRTQVSGTCNLGSSPSPATYEKDGFAPSFSYVAGSKPTAWLASRARTAQLYWSDVSRQLRAASSST